MEKEPNLKAEKNNAEPETVPGHEIMIATMEEILSERQQALSEIKPDISLKFYYKLKEKLENETDLYKRIIKFEQSKSDYVAEYSYPLDSMYFEQHLLNQENE